MTTTETKQQIIDKCEDSYPERDQKTRYCFYLEEGTKETEASAIKQMGISKSEFSAFQKEFGATTLMDDMIFHITF